MFLTGWRLVQDHGAAVVLGKALLRLQTADLSRCPHMLEGASTLSGASLVNAGLPFFGTKKDAIAG